MTYATLFSGTCLVAVDSRQLVGALRDRTASWGCRRLWLTSEPHNATAHRKWLALRFTNMPGDHVVDGVEVVSDFKGPGRDRAVYELPVAG